MAKYKLTLRAKEDFRRIYLYGLENFGEQQADKYKDKLVKHFNDIAKNPLMYPAVSHIRKSCRRCVCASDSIFYRIAGDGVVEIIAILGQQDIGNIF